MFQTLIYPPSGAGDCVVELPHRSFCSRFVLLQVEVCNTGTTQNQPHQISNTQRTEEKNDRCSNSTTQSQAPDDGYIYVRNILST